MSNNSKLQSIVSRVEKLEEEKAAVANDIKDIYLEAKSDGFDPKIIKKVIALRKKSKQARDEEEELIRVYMAELGQLADTPLGRAAVEREFS